ncbi:MAG TPA: histidine kinase dimerization/phosphoacceptor domain -containing protein, partial [Puia sp.]|nr:histidine kinase dimerization/phosphoacceptor domain -containing protein [Puia sp.]
QKHGGKAPDPDSALLLTSIARNLNIRPHIDTLDAEIQLINAKAWRQKGDNKKWLSSVLDAIRIYQQAGAWLSMGNTCMDLGGTYGAGDGEAALKKRMEHFREALAAYRHGGSEWKLEQANALKNIADMNSLFRNYGEARIEEKEALAIFLAAGKKDIQDVYDLLGLLSDCMGDSPEAVRYGLEAIRTANAVNDTSVGMCTIYHRLGNSYTNWGRLEEAQPLERKALDIAVKYKDEEATTIVLTAVCNILSKLGRNEEALKLTDQTLKKVPILAHWNSAVVKGWRLNLLLALHRNRETQPLVTELVRFLDDPKEDHYLLPQSFYTALVRYYLSIGKDSIAMRYCIRDRQIANITSPRARSSAYYLQALVDSALGNFSAALADFQTHKAISDSLISATRNYQIAQIQTEFQTEQKERDLRLRQKELDLLTSRNRLQDASIHKAALVRNTVIIVTLLLLILLYTGYYFKQRSHQQLQSKQVAIRLQNQQLAQLLAEKESLVYEVHHRVRNNLQVIISLLNTQCEFLEHPDALKAIRESRERLQAIALIHQKLYNTGTQPALINMRQYVEEMIRHLRDSYEATGGSISISQDIGELDLDISQAVPVGLVLNEAITNSVKYAFTKDIPGTIDISLTPRDRDQVLLRIADNGRGLPAGFRPEESQSLGLKLIQLFSQQLKGELRFHNKSGLEITMLFTQRRVSPLRTSVA